LFLLEIYFFPPKYQAIFEKIRPFFERKWRVTDKDGLRYGVVYMLHRITGQLLMMI
jgi:hypothetical protein